MVVAGSRVPGRIARRWVKMSILKKCCQGKVYEHCARDGMAVDRIIWRSPSTVRSADARTISVTATNSFLGP